MKFTTDEKSIISIYASLNREALIEKMKIVLDDTSEEDIIDCVKSIIDKLSAMTDKEYETADLVSDFDVEDE